MFRMRALAVQEELGRRGLAALSRSNQEAAGGACELGWVAGSECKGVADLPACMQKEDVGFYARQGWTGVDGVWECRMGVRGAQEYLRAQAAKQEESRGSWRELRVEVPVGCGAGWRMRKRRGSDISN